MSTLKPDFDVWKEYAYQRSLHPAVMTYLEIKKSDFYWVESTVDGKNFVTARGWDDLSQMIQLYESNNLTVDIKLISQYVQNPRIAKDFSVYYDLFLKYKSDYQVAKILAGNPPKEIKERAMAAKFDERLSLIGMLLDAVNEELKASMQSGQIMKELTSSLVEFKNLILKTDKSPCDHMADLVSRKRDELAVGKKSRALSRDAQYRLKQLIAILDEQRTKLFGVDTGSQAFILIKKDFDERIKKLKTATSDAGKRLSNMFKFCESVFPDGQEMLIIVTELTINPNSAAFINKYGCDEYFKHNKDLLIHDKQQEIAFELASLKLD